MRKVKPMNPIKTETEILASAMDILARDIESNDGVANAAIAEAAERLRELNKAILETLEENRHLADGEDCTLLKLKRVVKWS